MDDLRKEIVSVIIPTYNRRHVLSRAIDSVLNQSFKPFEVIVIDDGSTDGTSEYVSSVPEVTLIQIENQGVSFARNVGIKAARGKYIASLDSDDYWFKDKLLRQMEIVQQNPETKIIYTNEVWIRNGKRVNQCKIHQKYGGWIFKKCLPLCLISPSSVMIERALLLNEGGYDESLPACEDYDLWLRLSSKYPVYFLDEPLIYKTGGHEDQLSRRHWGMDRFRVKALLRALTFDLSADDREALLFTLHQKCTVIEEGFKKRGKILEAKTYEDIASKIAGV